MRIDTEIRKSDDNNEKYDQNTWLIFKPELSCHDNDLILMGKMMSALDKYKCKYNLKYNQRMVTSLEVRECYMMKLLTNILWK